MLTFILIIVVILLIIQTCRHSGAKADRNAAQAESKYQRGRADDCQQELANVREGHAAEKNNLHAAIESAAAELTAEKEAHAETAKSLNHAQARVQHLEHEPKRSHHKKH
jgi:hypothetical protein